MFSLMDTVVLCIVVFVAGFIDSVAGGGGLISLPAYFLLGIDPHLAVGTNKFPSACGTVVSTLRFMKNKKVHYQSAFVSVICALIGSTIGAHLSMYVDGKYLKYVLILVIPFIAYFVIKKKDFGETSNIPVSQKKLLIISGISAFVIGMYDGFLGPGTGTLLILVYTAFVGFDLVTASGNAKIVNLASNIAAVTTFILNGKVIFALAIPAAVCGILGNYLGSGFALKNGAKVIRPFFIGVLCILFIFLIQSVLVGL